MPIAVEDTARVDVAVPPLLSVTLAWLRDAARPVGETVAERETVPVKLKRLAKVIDDVPVEPDWTVRLAVLGEMLKFGGFNGLSRVNLTLVGVEVPSTYNRSRVTPIPVAFTLNPWLSVFESSSVNVEDQDPPAGRRT